MLDVTEQEIRCDAALRGTPAAVLEAFITLWKAGEIYVAGVRENGEYEWRAAWNSKTALS